VRWSHYSSGQKNCFHEQFKTIKTVGISKFIMQAASSRLSGRHSGTPDSRTCWVDSEAQWDSSCWQIVDGRGEEQHQRLGWGDQRGSEIYKIYLYWMYRLATCLMESKSWRPSDHGMTGSELQSTPVLLELTAVRLLYSLSGRAELYLAYLSNAGLLDRRRANRPSLIAVTESTANAASCYIYSQMSHRQLYSPLKGN